MLTDSAVPVNISTVFQLASLKTYLKIPVKAKRPTWVAVTVTMGAATTVHQPTHPLLPPQRLMVMGLGTLGHQQGTRSPGQLTRGTQMGQLPSHIWGPTTALTTTTTTTTRAQLRALPPPTHQFKVNFLKETTAPLIAYFFLQN